MNGEQLKLAGQAKVSRKYPAEANEIMAAIELWARTKKHFTAEDVRNTVRLPIPHPNLLGSCFGTAHVQGIIEFVGFKEATRSARRAGVLRVWKGKES